VNTGQTRRKEVRRRDCCIVSMALSSLALEGCRRGPSFNILGSFFPGWIACIVVGIFLTVVVRLLLVKFGWEARIPVAPLFYVCLTVLLGCLFWLLFFE
jgi:hypothetical protein